MSNRQRKLSSILADYVSPSTSSAKRLQLKAKLKPMYPVYKNNYKCKGDANRFIANVGGKWKYGMVPLSVICDPVICGQ